MLQSRLISTVATNHPFMRLSTLAKLRTATCYMKAQQRDLKKNMKISCSAENDVMQSILQVANYLIYCPTRCYQMAQHINLMRAIVCMRQQWIDADDD